MLMQAWKLGPALAAGNTVVMKVKYMNIKLLTWLIMLLEGLIDTSVSNC